MKDIKVVGVTVRLSHKDHEHKLDFIKNNDSGKYEVWIDGKLIRLAGIFSILQAKRELKKHLKQ